MSQIEDLMILFLYRYIYGSSDIIIFFSHVLTMEVKKKCRITFRAKLDFNLIHSKLLSPTEDVAGLC